jgi:hypothetical protein
MRVHSALVLLCMALATTVSGQLIQNPTYGLRSHETMEIKGVEIRGDMTLIHLTVENKVISGYFCIDRNTSLIMPDGTKYKLVKAEGLPFCPVLHNFQKVGEILSFTLQFPPIGDKVAWFDLIEECSDNCFSVYAITLDPAMNSEIERGYNLSEFGKSKESSTVFEEIIASIGTEKHGILGSLYSSTIIMHLRNGDEISAKKWYELMLNSGAPNLSLYVANLNSRGIKW